MWKRTGTALAAVATVLALGAAPAHADSPQTHAFRVEHQVDRYTFAGDTCVTSTRHRRVYDLPFGGEFAARWSPWHVVSTLGAC